MATAFIPRPTQLYSPLSPSSGLPSPSFPPAVLSPSPAPISRRQSRQQSLRIAPFHHHDFAAEDVLLEGDIIGHGDFLHGELIETVHISTSASRSQPPPAHQLQVVRKLGAGTYATVYLVKEIIGRTLAPSAHNDEELSDSEDSVRYSYTYGREFAVKCLSKYALTPEELDVQMSEATLHQSLPSHPNIVTLYRTLQTRSWLLLVLESVPGQDLFYFLEQSRDHHTHQQYNPVTGGADSDPLSVQPSPTNRSTASLASLSQQISGATGSSPMTTQTPPTPSLLSTLHPNHLLSYQRLRLITSMFRQMCDAVDACHARGVSHRDIKPENFIVTDGVRTVGRSGVAGTERKVIVKLSDFGLATLQQESTDVDCGSAPYMSYECRNNVYPTYATQPADVWSLGIVLINMLYHHNPWSDTSIKPTHCHRDSASASCYSCPSFAAFLVSPVQFFLQRFPGMTHAVADFLANRVFCILPAPGTCPSPRVTAREFGEWVKGLPRMMGQGPPSIPAALPTRPSYVARPSKLDSIHIVQADEDDEDEDEDDMGMHMYKSPVVFDDGSLQPVINLSHVKSSSPRVAPAAFSESEVSNCSPNTQNRTFAQGDGADEASKTADENFGGGVGASTGDDDVQSTRSGTKKRGKRGARKKNPQQQEQPPLPNQSQEDEFPMASNVESLARELSRTQFARHGSVSRMSIGSGKSKSTHRSGRSAAERALAKMPPPPNVPPPSPPSPLSSNVTSSGLGRSLAIAGMNMEGKTSPAMIKVSLSPAPSGPAPLPSTSPVTVVAEPHAPAAPHLLTAANSVPVNPGLTPKTSWRRIGERLGFNGASSVSSHSALGLSSGVEAPTAPVPAPATSDRLGIPQKSLGFKGTSGSLRESKSMKSMTNDLLVGSPPPPKESSTMANVRNMLSSLEAQPVNVPSSKSSKNGTLSNPSEEDLSTRGRRNIAISPPSSSAFGRSHWGGTEHSPSSGGRSAARGALSTSPPSSTGYAAPSFTSSLDSPNWRSTMPHSQNGAPSISGMSTVTSSSGSSMSVYSSKFSNGSVRSVSTAATSVSGKSDGGYRAYTAEPWRHGGSAESNAPPRPRKPRSNVKVMDGMPGNLDGLPRQHRMLSGKQNMPPTSNVLRGKAPNPLGTISERTSAQSPPISSPISSRRPDTASSLNDRESTHQSTYPKSIASTSHFSTSSLSLGQGPSDQKKGTQKPNAISKVLSLINNKS